MGARRYMVVVVACLLLGVAQGQRSQEFLVTLINGRTLSCALDEDWTPEVRQGQIVFRPAVRILAMDVVLIRPFAPNDVSGLKLVKLLSRTRGAQGGSVQVWVEFDPLRPDAPVDNATGLVQVAPQTWIRPEAFRMVLE